MKIRRAALVAVAGAALGAAPVRAQTPEPYRDPPFTCVVVDYGTDPPEVPAPPQDPLCVRYDKTNITVSTLGVVDFLAAEPGRVAIVAGKCSYWQQDHWVVRASPETPPLVSWEGSYWYDAPSGSAAGILRDLRVADQPADAQTFLEALRSVFGDATADQLAAFADEGGGGGATFSLPEGFGGDPCAASAEPPPPDDGGGGGPAPGGGGGSGDGEGTTSQLPETGSHHPVWLAALLLLLVGAVRGAQRAAR
jgi:hypothetical protein